MGFFSKVFRSVTRATKAVVTGGLSEVQKRASDKAKSEAEAAKRKLLAEQKAARDLAAGAAGGALRRRQASRQASLLGSYDPSQSSSLLE